MGAQFARNILMIGFMGTGKSTIAQKLKTLLKMEEVDIDAMIVKRAGKPISDIFADEGEAAFRKLETEALQSLVGCQSLIISCGGGLAMQPQNQPIMKQAGVVVLLTATPKTVLKRVGHSTHRPLLNGRMHEQGIAELMDARAEQYAKCADVTVSTDHKTVAQIAKDVIAQLQAFEQSQSLE